MKRPFLINPVKISSRTKIVFLWLQGMSARNISSAMNISVSTVYRWISRWYDEGSMLSRTSRRRQRTPRFENTKALVPIRLQSIKLPDSFVAYFLHYHQQMSLANFYHNNLYKNCVPNEYFIIDKIRAKVMKMYTPIMFEMKNTQSDCSSSLR